MCKTSILCCGLFLFFIKFSAAQNIDLESIMEIPLETKAELDAFEKQVPKYFIWLQNNSLQHEKRPMVNALLLKWLEGTSTMTITLHPYVMDYSKKNPDFFLLFMLGWANYVLENPTEKDNELQANLAGVKTILEFYKKGKSYGVKKDRKIQKLLKLQFANKLESFISKKIK